MKTDSELEQIFDTIRDSKFTLRADCAGTGLKLLRSIQLDALREARETIMPECRSMDGEDAMVIATGIEAALDKLIRELELK